MKNKKNILVLVGIILIAVIVMYVAERNESDFSKKVKIGVLAPISGPAAFYGEHVVAGIRNMNFDTNKVEVIYEDTVCDVKTGLSAYRKLIDYHQVDYILGPSCSAVQEAVAPLLSVDSVVALLPSGGSGSLYDLSNNFMFNNFSLENEGQHIADLLNQKGVKKASVIVYANTFSILNSEAFSNKFKGEIVYVKFNEREDNTATELLKIKDSDVEATFATDVSFFAYGDGLNTMDELGLSDIPIYSTYITELPEIREGVEGIKYTFPEINTAEGGVEGLAYSAAVDMAEVIDNCSADRECAKKFFLTDLDYKNGVLKKPIILKEIINGETEVAR